MQKRSESKKDAQEKGTRSRSKRTPHFRSRSQTVSLDYGSGPRPLADAQPAVVATGMALGGLNWVVLGLGSRQRWGPTACVTLPHWVEGPNLRLPGLTAAQIAKGP